MYGDVVTAQPTGMAKMVLDSTDLSRKAAVELLVNSYEGMTLCFCGYDGKVCILKGLIRCQESFFKTVDKY